MGYTPILIVNYDDLNEFVENYWELSGGFSQDENTVYKEYIKEALDSTCIIGGLKLCVISSTDTSYQSTIIRELLEKNNVEFGPII